MLVKRSLKRTLLIILSVSLLLLACPVSSKAESQDFDFDSGTGETPVSPHTANDLSVEDFVTITYEDSGLGIRVLPQLSHSRLGENRAARDFMAKLHAIVKEQDTNLTVMQAQYPSDAADSAYSNEVILDSYAVLADDVLSLVVSYTPVNPNEPLYYSQLSLNLDVTTGQELTYQDLLSKAGFTEDDVIFSFREIGRQFLQKDLSSMVFYQACDEGRLPEESELELNFADFEDQMQEAVDRSMAAIYGQVDPYTGEIGEPPALLYGGWNRLSISGFVPTMAGAGYTSYLLPIAQTPDQLSGQAYSDCFGNQILGFGFLSPEAALDGAMKAYNLDENGYTEDGVPLTFALTGMENLQLAEDLYEPCYLIEAYEDLGDHKSNYGWLYVSAFSGAILNYDVITDSYSYVEGNFYPYDGDILTDGRGQGAIATILSNLDAYEEWLTRPHFTASLPEIFELDTSTFGEGEILRCLVTAMYPHTEVSVEYSNRSGQWGEMDQTIYTANLELGESLSIIYPAVGANHVGVRVSSPQGKSFWNLQYLQDEPDRIVYLQPESYVADSFDQSLHLPAASWLEEDLTSYIRLRPLPPELAGIARHKNGPPVEASDRIYFSLNLPEILLDSSDAQAANAEIADLEQKLVQQYQTAEAEEPNPDYFLYRQNTGYSAYAKHGVLSVSIIFNDFNYLQQGEDPILPHYIYNFDLASGQLLSDQELLNKLAGREVDLDMLAEANIARDARQMADYFEDTARQYYYENPDPDFSPSPYIGISDLLTARSLAYYRQQAEGLCSDAPTNRIYIANNGELMIRYLCFIMAGAGSTWKDAHFSLSVFPPERELNPLYVHFREALDQDPWAEDCQALIAYLGPSGDEAAVSEALLKVASLQDIDFQTFEVTPLLSEASVDEYAKFATFTELYLLVPKYKYATIQMVDVELNEASELVEVESPGGILDSKLAMDAAIIGLSSETLPSAGLRISTVQEEGELWYPSLSGRDGSLILPEYIQDCTADMEDWVASDPYARAWLNQDLLIFIMQTMQEN